MWNTLNQTHFELNAIAERTWYEFEGPTSTSTTATRNNQDWMEKYQKLVLYTQSSIYPAVPDLKTKHCHTGWEISVSENTTKDQAEMASLEWLNLCKTESSLMSRFLPKWSVLHHFFKHSYLKKKDRKSEQTLEWKWISEEVVITPEWIAGFSLSHPQKVWWK